MLRAKVFINLIVTDYSRMQRLEEMRMKQVVIVDQESYALNQEAFVKIDSIRSRGRGKSYPTGKLE